MASKNNRSTGSKLLVLGEGIGEREIEGVLLPETLGVLEAEGDNDIVADEVAELLVVALGLEETDSLGVRLGETEPLGVRLLETELLGEVLVELLGVLETDTLAELLVVALGLFDVLGVKDADCVIIGPIICNIEASVLALIFLALVVAIKPIPAIKFLRKFLLFIAQQKYLNN